MANQPWGDDSVERPDLDGYDPYPTEPETHLRDYWYVVLKRRWLILAIAITVLGGFTIRAMTQKPVYSATSVLHLDRGRINLVQDVVQDYWSYSEFYPTQRRVLRSRTLAHRVVEDVRLWEHPAFRSKDGSRPEGDGLEGLAGAVMGMLQVNQIPNTQLLELRFTSPAPELSARLANSLAEQYIAFNREEKFSVAKNTAGFISEQVEKLQREILENEKRLQDYSKREDLLMVDEKEVIVMRQLEDLNAEATQAGAARASAEARYRSLLAAQASTLNEVQSDPSVSSLKRERDRILSRVEELSSTFKDDWPELRRARESLADIERRLSQEENAVAAKVIANAQVQYQEALSRETLLKREADAKKHEFQGLSELTADYSQIKTELDNQRQMLQQLLRRESETGLSAELGEEQPVNVRIVETALVPKGPDGPGVRRSVALGAFVGIAIALGIAFFLDYWQTNIDTVEDLRRHFPLPLLGMVPRLNTGKAGALLGLEGIRASLAEGAGLLPSGEKKSPATTRSALALERREPRDRDRDRVRASSNAAIVAERFKFLRGSLLMSTPGSAPQTILVIGADKNAGKTFVSCNLAASLADLGKKVLLIDADLRNPQLHKIFKFKNRVGLSNVLTGQTSIERGCIFSTPVQNVYVLLAGPQTPRPAELLGSAKMEETIAECARHFDFVLLDSAPLLPVFDSHYLTRRCDANLLVVRSGRTSRHAIKQSLDLVEGVGGKVTGAVLNDVNLSDFAQNYYYSYHSYEYGDYAAEPVERQAVAR
jgi:capsular exopolysaccharide synthesis family protein